MSAVVLEFARPMSRAEKGAVLAECWRVLGGGHDPLRAVWDEQTTTKDRRLLMAMAGMAKSRIDKRVGWAWCDLSPEDRVSIKGGLRRWSAWAGRLK